MKKLWKSFTLCTAMYSALPTPKTDWDGDSMSHVFCFFPWIGLVVGGVEALWWLLARWLSIEGILYGAVAALLPIAVTGGIHVDGFLDVCDARGSHQSREKKLEILKDSHVGAFAVLGLGWYLLLSAALWSEVEFHLSLCLLPVVSRTLSGLCAVYWRNARGTGLLASFTDASHLKHNRVVLILWLLLAALLMGSLPGFEGIAALFGAGVALLYYRVVSCREFGGITGDLAGWFLQLCELLGLLAVVILQKGAAVCI